MPTESRSALSRDRVLRTAIEFADRHGLEGLSMRKLADELGAGAMSLYHYVANREDLIDGMIDLVFAEIDNPVVGGDWRTEMRRRAVSTRAVLNRHRWAVGRMDRMNPGLEGIQHREATLGCLREAGFSVEMTIQALSVQDAYIYGFALQEKVLPFDDAEESKATAVETTKDVADIAEHFPYLAEIVVGHVAKYGYDFNESFEFGLELVLDGIEKRHATNGPASS